MAKPGNHATVPGGQGKALAAQDKQLGLPISFRPSLVNKYFPQYNGAVGKKISAVHCKNLSIALIHTHLTGQGGQVVGLVVDCR